MEKSDRTPDLCALILAGGKSSRMGQDKALLPLEGKPLLTRTCQIAQSCANSVWVISPWPERYREILPANCQLIQEAIADSQGIAHGPLVGFAQGLTQITTEWVLLLACDLPQLQPEPLQQWSQLLEALPESTLAFLPQHPKGWEPLCGFYRQRCLTSLQAFIAQGGRSFQAWLSAQNVQPIPQVNLSMLLNCNTPQEWQQIERS
ncbi:molybdenum cofactor guanylyltransferase [Desertifilum sp. FACHB-1129]|uniref:Probable molybdenum cofactor guanylyltransferase n=1 Tax=Desertifilum tharense IPPAS B-1220 TaxID=1781255 RepID=A0A1E5QFA7_9CYAN|nr:MULTISPECIES: molybdenum cofactor guanylyltransferase [Desertifilum]MDA0213027.1 molybdenum cofactor guanylyltransferase [Cyanobacteria bacterium FC1]MBD2314842.1 molybdenum cofactor guanylyltransferase [Desertifilum sp. FACHB-1129]MBD2324835.1 molybdenum cofactor guanylyltransferase [Desertifilum sp. FACHB-866]MBD2334917.1 molybdenum cofactor guanylyltransferase [Desertifilum sp. FACHB-868]OEJ73365.1 molybdenum cofactor guanylyltransferase [Desertifilum tharense IPPAS B-1220]